MESGDRLTPNSRLTLVSPNRLNWSSATNNNFSIIDGLISTFIAVQNLQGIWANNTLYREGDRVIDIVTGFIWNNNVEHTTPSPPVIFSDERDNNPEYWSLFTNPASAIAVEAAEAAAASAEAAALSEFNATQGAISASNDAASAAISADVATDALAAIEGSIGTVIGSAGTIQTTPIVVVGVGICVVVIIDGDNKPIFAIDEAGALWVLVDGYLVNINDTFQDTSTILKTSGFELPGVGPCVTIFTGSDDKPYMAVGTDGAIYSLSNGILAPVGGSSGSGAESYVSGTAYISIFNTEADRDPYYYADENVIYMFLVMGQSLALGSNPDDSIPVDTARTTAAWQAANPSIYYPDNVLMFGVTGESFGRVDPEGVAVDRFVPCAEEDIPNPDPDSGYTKESICTVFGNTIYERFLNKTGTQKTILMAIAAHGGTPYRGMIRGTYTYTEGMRLVTAAASIAAADGKRIVLAGVIIKHGEADNSLGVGVLAGEYAQYLDQWQKNFSADACAILAQYQPVPFFVTQCNRTSSSTSADSKTPWGALLASKLNSNVHCIGPIYQVMADSTETHPRSWGYMLQAAHDAYAAFDTVFDVGYVPMKYIKAYRQTATTIRVEYTRPVNLDPDGIIDGTQDDIATNAGFILHDGLATVAISGVAVVGSVGTSRILEITHAVFTGLFPRLMYASYSSVGKMGRINGPRGRVCTAASWGTVRNDTAVGNVENVRDWACTETIFLGVAA